MNVRKGNLTTQLKNVNQTIDYKYSEDKILEELKSYIDGTYDQHYSQNKFQATEFIMDSGHGKGFCIGNIMKYSKRYGNLFQDNLDSRQIQLQMMTPNKIVFGHFGLLFDQMLQVTICMIYM